VASGQWLVKEKTLYSLATSHWQLTTTMIVGSLRVRLLLREARTLKDKRQVVNSIKDKLKQRFNVSVAEVEEQDNRQMAVLGFAMVGNEVSHVRTTLQQIVEALRAHPVAEFIDHELEV
jgi:uncharacterized protein YlxP (DUF503 family)